MSASYGNQPPPESPDQILTISQLTAIIKDALEEAFPLVWVSGEISDIAKPRSGHIYLSLKDDSAQIRAVIWRNAAQRLKFDLEDGMEVVCLGSMDVYPPRGGYQLVLRQIEPVGQGAHHLAFKQLHKRLAAEGLFDPARKRPLPKLPRRVAVVTSPTGAAVRDFLEVLRRRWRGIEIVIVPTRVQGEGAAQEIARAIDNADRMTPAVDLIVVTRGGGSLEDLWCFNEEPVVRSVARARLPVVSAIGHEIDVTLCDLAADVRALTPSEAAERIVPHREEVLAMLQNYQQRLSSSLRNRATQARAHLQSLENRRVLKYPLDRIRQLAEQLDGHSQQAARAMQNQLNQARQRLAVAAGKLDSLSPLAILARGYTVTQTEQRRVVTRATDVSVGDNLTTITSAGKIFSRVEELLDLEVAESDSSPPRHPQE